MKTTMKKTAAYLLAMLLIFQMLPAMADETESNTVQPITDYRDKLDITAVTKTLTVGMKITLTVNENYEKVVWTSQNENIATVDQNGVVTGISEGKVKITATEDGHSDSITLLVVAAAAPAEPETTEENDDSDIQETPEEEPETPYEDMIIFINGQKQRLAYNGSEYINTYSVTSNRSDFSADRLHLTEEGSAHLAHATNGGVAYDSLTEEDFYYDSDETVTFVITNGWLQIRPATLNIYVDDATKREGEPDPAFSAELEGLKGSDTAESIGIQYSVTEDNRIIPNVSANDIIGNYRVGTVFAGKLTVIKAQPLYNIAKIGSKYYRLAKTQIWTEWKLENPNFGKVLTNDQYTADPYDFSELTITVDGKDYLYNCRKNAEAILKGANYYDIKSTKVTIIKEKIGAMDGNTPRWAVPEEQRYDDPNNLNSYHRDYELTLHTGKATVTEQRAYNFLSVDGSANYYKLPTTAITAKPLDKYSNGRIAEGEYILERYDFSNTVVTIDGVEYRYNDGSLTEYDNYYTVSFEDVQKIDVFNRDKNWFNNREGWLDGAYEEYGDLPYKTVGYHANYKAVTHKAVERIKSITLTSDYTRAKGYVGEKITLTAHLSGFEGLTEGVDYRLEWQYKTDNDGNWTAVRNAQGTTHTFILNQTTTHYTWRVVAVNLQ